MERVRVFYLNKIRILKDQYEAKVSIIGRGGVRGIRGWTSAYYPFWALHALTLTCLYLSQVPPVFIHTPFAVYYGRDPT